MPTGVSDIPTGLRIPAQIPLDTKSWSISESVLSDLGVADNLAYTYFEGLIVTCQEEKSKWEWREGTIEEEKLLGTDFVYPSNWIKYGIDYSLRSFNFFKYLDLEDRVSDLETIVSTEYTTIVYVNTNSPNLATVFDTQNPPVINDDILKANENNLYIGVNLSTWVYNPLIVGYVTKSVPFTSNFYLTGTTIDAGNSKTASIKRDGDVEFGGSVKVPNAVLATEAVNKGQLDARAPYDIFKFLQKGFENTDLENDEIGDIFSGWTNDGTIRYTEAEWLGGVLTDSDNFKPLVQTQVIDDI